MNDRFISADSPNKKGLRVTYWRPDGSNVIRVGGYRTWRNQNPGNIKASGSFAREHGSIGKAGGFAVFPSYEVGRAATFSLLKIPKNQERTISKTIEDYAPKEDGNNPERYKRLVHRWTGLDLKRKVKDLSEKELTDLVKAIERMEGYKPGKIIEAPAPNQKKKITAVRKNKKGTIISYCIDGIGWVSKVEGIRLARKGQIDAVVAKSRSGSLFLRTRPGTPIEIQLDHLG